MQSSHALPPSQWGMRATVVLLSVPLHLGSAQLVRSLVATVADRASVWSTPDALSSVGVSMLASSAKGEMVFFVLNSFDS